MKAGLIQHPKNKLMQMLIDLVHFINKLYNNHKNKLFLEM